MVRRGFLFLLPVLLLGTLPAGAISVFSSESALNATSGINFTDISMASMEFAAPAAFYVLGTSPLDVTFTGSSQLNSILLSSPGPAEYGIKAVSNGTTITITLPTGAVAFGGFFGFAPGTGVDLAVSGVGDSPFSYTLSAATSSNPVYLGITSATALSSVTVSASFGAVALNHFTIGMPDQGGGGGDPGGSETPEPGTMALMGAALMALPLVAWGKRRK